jgi:hypothetical protein
MDGHALCMACIIDCPPPRVKVGDIVRIKDELLTKNTRYGYDPNECRVLYDKDMEGDLLVASLDPNECQGMKGGMVVLCQDNQFRIVDHESDLA